MAITIEQFKETIDTGRLHKVGLHAIQRVHGITVKQYCNKLLVRGGCSRQCASCALAIPKRMDTMLWENAQHPYALYTWMLKDLTAKTVEVKRETQKAAPILKPLLPEVDALDTLLEMF